MIENHKGMLQRVFLTICFAVPHIAFSAESCPAIKCDCDYLPTTAWVEVCSTYETHIKKECVANFNTPKDYCLMHGLNASPIALAMQIGHDGKATKSSSSASEVISTYSRIVDSAFTVIDQSLSEGEYAKAMDGFKLVEESTRKQFTMQQSLIWDDSGEIKSLWKMYSPVEEKAADKLSDISKRLSKDLTSATTSRSEKVFHVLLVKSLRIQGLLYEHAAYAENWLDRTGNAAKLWKSSADTSLQLLELAKGKNGDSADKRFNEIQAAARLQQASIFWMKNKDVKAVNATLKQAGDLLGTSSKLDISPIIAENEKATKKTERKVNTTLECMSGKKPHLCR
ncbi:hypothetical protein TDB9533_01433 [Thalassocella blandensis]|nr:hypothetical protein TDB9533_01433 [Thalassocella blandensis]